MPCRDADVLEILLYIFLTRHFKCRLFEWSCFLQGGVTEEQMLKFMGANTNLSVLQAKELLEVFFVSQILVAISSLYSHSCVLFFITVVSG